MSEETCDNWAHCGNGCCEKVPKLKSQLSEARKALDAEAAQNVELRKALIIAATEPLHKEGCLQECNCFKKVFVETLALTKSHAAKLTEWMAKVVEAAKQWVEADHEAVVDEYDKACDNLTDVMAQEPKPENP